MATPSGPVVAARTARSDSAPIGRSAGPKSRSAAIQGLRALAVCAVVADHLLHKPSGGFVGVDVFFVISGYLITGLLLREVDRHGRIDLLGFYKRRIKRTVPLAIAVIGVSLIVGSLFFPAYRFAQLVDAARAAGSFSINWQLIALGTDYLHSTDLPTPLQHFWSLAVEEQFYLIWPAALIAIVAVARRLPTSPRVAVGIMSTAAIVTSLAFCFWQTRAEPTAAYFSTFGRAWELGVGALLAVCSPLLSRLPSAWRPAMAWAGTAGIVLSVVRIDPSSAFPAPWAMLPVLSTALVVTASEGGQDVQVYPLTNRLSQYVGDLSYSIYLWHFPIIIFVSTMIVDQRASHLVQFALIATTSVLSFHLLETPLRTARWRRVFETLPRFNVQRPSPVVALSTIALVASVVSIPVLGAMAPNASAAGESASATRPVDALRTAYAASSLSPTEMALRSAVTTAAKRTTWPDQVRSDVASGNDHMPTIWTERGCLWLQHDPLNPLKKADRCTTGSDSAPKTAVLLGDSIALSYYPAVRQALDSKVWRIRILTAEQCPAWRMDIVRDDKSSYPECDSFRKTALRDIAQRRPDLVIVASSYSAIWRAQSPAGTSAVDSWAQGASATTGALSKAAKQVLVLDAPQMSPPLRDCLTPMASPVQCSGTVDQSYADAFTSETSAIDALHLSNVRHPAVPAWYCTQQGVCPPVIDGRQVLADGMHPSESDAPRISQAIRNALSG